MIPSGGAAQTEAVSRFLCRRGWRLAAAESCTGGRILDRLAARPGASAWLAGGIVAYEARVKVLRLGVPEGMIRTHGAVSAEVARAMAEGVRRAFTAEAGLATTGIAGPGGARPGKLLGLVHLAASVPGRTVAAAYRFEGDREAVREAAADAALRLLAGMLATSSCRPPAATCRTG